MFYNSFTKIYMSIDFLRYYKFAIYQCIAFSYDFLRSIIC